MEHLMQVEQLTTVFAGDGGETEVLDRVSFSVRHGEILGIVGESGCGKSVTALSVMGLLGKNGWVSGGSVRFEGRELLSMSERELDRVRGSALTMIFQDPLTSLNPVFTVGNQLMESLRIHLGMSRRAARERAIALLGRVGLADAADTMKKYPHMLSGGMRQRVMIDMALACEPRLLIADEPTTALDVTIQAQIMRLLRSIQQENGMSVLLITHDLGLVAQMCDRVLVMYAGQIVEQATVEELFAAPTHPYTRMLLASVPDLRGQNQKLSGIAGQLSSRYGEMQGCRFAERCPYAQAGCEQPQGMRRCGTDAAHLARCHVFGGAGEEAET